MTKAKQLGITDFPYKEFDSNGKIIYYENSSGVWVKYERDSNSNLIYKKYSDDDWVKYDYDSNNNKIYLEDSYGYGFFSYYEGDIFIKEIREGYKEHYLTYKRNLKLNNLLND